MIQRDEWICPSWEQLPRNQFSTKKTSSIAAKPYFSSRAYCKEHRSQRHSTLRDLLHHGRRAGDEEMTEIRVVSGETNLILHMETYQL